MLARSSVASRHSVKPFSSHGQQPALPSHCAHSHLAHRQLGASPRRGQTHQGTQHQHSRLHQHTRTVPPIAALPEAMEVGTYASDVLLDLAEAARLVIPGIVGDSELREGTCASPPHSATCTTPSGSAAIGLRSASTAYLAHALKSGKRSSLVIADSLHRATSGIRTSSRPIQASRRPLLRVSCTTPATGPQLAAASA